MEDGFSEELNKAIDLHRSGKLLEAELMYRSILDKTPGDPEALHLLGLVAFQTGHARQARQLILAAIEQKTDDPKYHFNLGFVREASGLSREAMDSYWSVLKLEPFNEKTIGRMQGLDQSNPHFWFHLGNHFFWNGGHVERSIPCYKKALELDKDMVLAHINLATMLEKQGGQDDIVLSHYQRAIELKPDSLEANFNLALFLEKSGKMDKAKQIYENILLFHPDDAQTNFSMSNIELLKGDFENGLKNYEWRMKMDDWVSKYPSFIFEKPAWNGEPFQGKTLLIHEEQGFGDTLMFVRYIPLVKQLGGKIIFVTTSPLFGLFRQIPGIDILMERSHDRRDFPDFDCYVFLLSLPRIFQTRIDTIPADIPYLRSDSHFFQKQPVNVKAAQKARAGLVWAGQPKHCNDRNRSIRIDQFSPLLEIKDIMFIGLQKGERSGEAGHLMNQFKNFINMGEECRDFSDTASVISALDLLITVDTSVAHLAGAMGKEVWVLLPVNNDWRWLQDRNTSPWYPSMTLFRQHQPGCWEDVIKSIKKKLLRLFR